MKDILKTTAWLNLHLNDADLIVLDASPKTNVSKMKSSLADVQIPGARYLDLKNDFSDQNVDLPNSIQSPADFEESARNLGINNSSSLIVYDNLGIYTSPRVWFLFKSMGFEKVFVLDGGLTAWVEEGYSIEAKKSHSFSKGDFKAHFNKDKLRDFDFLLSDIDNKRCQVIDARSAGRFAGTAPEPREGLRSGHIPNSVNLPFQEVLKDGKYKSTEELNELFTSLNLEDNPLVFSCGSGLTACIILMAAQMVLDNELHLYDGSWTEWAQKKP